MAETKKVNPKATILGEIRNGDSVTFRVSILDYSEVQKNGKVFLDIRKISKYEDKEGVEREKFGSGVAIPAPLFGDFERILTEVLETSEYQNLKEEWQDYEG